MDKEKPEFYSGVNCFTLPNGDTYLGEYCAHVSGKIWKEGLGVYHTQDGQFYEGHWKDDKLVDGTDVEITYLDQSKYNGSLLKNKYDGSGCYTFANGIKLFVNCSANLPVGEVMLADIDGRLWRGYVAGNRVKFSPENIFYKNIDRLRGVTKQITKNINPEWKPTPEVSQEAIATISDGELEKLIFTRNIKIDDRIDLTDSDWYRKYADYKNKREVILEKVKKHERLDKAEADWYVNYAKYKKIRKNRKMFKMETTKAVDTSLLDAFFSQEFKRKWKGVSTFYPSYNWVLPPESEGSFEMEEQSSSSVEELDEESSEVKLKEDVKEEELGVDASVSSGPLSVGVGTGSLYSLMDAIAGKKKFRSCKWDDADVEVLNKIISN